MAEQSPIHGTGTVVEKNEVPEGLKVGDKVKFVVENPKDTNATVWSKIEEKPKQD